MSEATQTHAETKHKVKPAAPTKEVASVKSAIAPIETASKKVTTPKIGKAATLAIILVRGLINSRTNIRDTIIMLRLHRKNACVLVPNTPSMQGMLKKAKDYITWGEINADTQKKLEGARKKSDGKMPVYHLNSPKKGFGKKGVKCSFNLGGALGNRGDKINDIIERMI